jgi:hypothetical protein
VLPMGSAGADSARSGGGGEVTVLHDAGHPSAITLPVIPSRCGRSVALTTATPAPARCAATYAEAIGGPTAPARCTAARALRYRLHRPRGTRIVTVRVYVNGTLRLRRHARDVRSVTLRGVPRGRFVVRIVTRRSDGTRAVRTRTYHGCALR